MKDWPGVHGAFDGNGSNLDVPRFSEAQGIPGYDGSRHGPGNIMKIEIKKKNKNKMMVRHPF